MEFCFLRIKSQGKWLGLEEIGKDCRVGKRTVALFLFGE